MERDIKEEADDEVAAPSAARAKLKVVAQYAMLAFAPVVAVLALVVAVVAIATDRSGKTESGEYTVRMESLNASLAETRGELSNLKVALAHEKSLREEERKKQDERNTKIVQSVSGLQTKLKMSPTLAEQLREPPNVPAAAPVAVSTAPVPAPAPVPEKAVAETTVKPHSAVKPVPASPEKDPAKVKVLKDAIEKFNNKK